MALAWLTSKSEHTTFLKHNVADMVKRTDILHTSLEMAKNETSALFTSQAFSESTQSRIDIWDCG